ncbi:Tegumental calcium-binding EF-hand protein 4 [Fasciolopsis buskii]|uniref:Tegumental calcium-binding EF-hand protein 4 n=1 Tax=Fasciolopsis buskii TaxID=27845 RepID=A0A8E0VH24_9TREM|nr:Tegumental calcium-binding EF-hand protein 4 [Fasciolopsis buski]
MTAYKLHDVESLIDWFMELDKNNDEKVDRNELMAAYQKHNIPAEKIDEWMKHFDADSDGKITLMEFCRGLGLRIDEMRVEQKQRADQRAGKAPSLGGDIEMIATTMSQPRQVEVTEKFKEIVNKHGGKDEEMKDVAHELKTFLDDNYGRVWQCVILTGSYWMQFSHEPFLSIQFRFGRHICLAWRTPRG